MVDIMKLDGVLKTGKLVGVDKAATIITPVFRASFPKLVEPQEFQGQGKPRFTLSMIFNGSNEDAPAFVDMKTVVGAALAKVAATHGVSLTAQKGANNPFKQGVKENQEGEPLAGYDEWSWWATASKYPKGPNSEVQCVDGQGRPLDPEAIYGGCYCRAQVDFYKPKSFQKIAIGLKWVQFVANGEPFGGSDETFSDFEEVPGAETPANLGCGDSGMSFDDDLPF